MTAIDPAIILIVSAPLSGAYGMYVTMEAIASKNYLMGFFSSFMLVFAGLCIGKLVWGGVL